MRFTSDDVRKHAENLNEVASVEIVSVHSYSPGDGSRRFELQWVGVSTQTVLGARATCDTLDAARYALEAMKAITEEKGRL